MSNDVAVKKEPKGIGGWLAWFVVSLFVSAALNTLAGLRTIVNVHAVSDVIGGMLGFAVGVLGFFAFAFLLQKKAMGVKLTYAYLVTQTIMWGLAAFGDPTHYGKSLLQAGISSAIWAMYFDKSKRVRNTFFPEPEQPAFTQEELEQQTVGLGAAAEREGAMTT